MDVYMHNDMKLLGFTEKDGTQMQKPRGGDEVQSRAGRCKEQSL